jgi:hypothetical protein
VDPSEDAWELLYLYERATEGALLFAGYYTLFAFVNPLRGKVLRVCQALILPHYQRQGEGRLPRRF